MLKRISECDLLNLATLLMLLGLILHGPTFWYCQLPLIALTIVGFVDREFRSGSGMWFAAGVLILASNYMNWFVADNHKYVLAYCCLILSCVYDRPAEQRTDVLRTNARITLGLVMGLSVVWKVISPDYLSGDFFRFTLLADQRFEFFTRLLTSATELELVGNNAAVDSLQQAHLFNQPDLTVLPINAVPKVQMLATFLTWWTVIIEGVLAGLFLFPLRGLAAWSRHVLLAIFVATTYAVATVPGFAWVVIVLGMSSTTENQRYFRVVYIGLLLLLQFFRIPFGDLITGNLPT